MHPLFQAGEGGSIPTSALDLRVHRIPTPLAAELNGIWHSRLPIYDTGFCLCSRACFGAEHQGVWYAAAIWSNPVAAALPQREWLELRRFAIADDAPKNTASRMLSVMVRFIRRDLPEVQTLCSYQDVEAHAGTIYKAAGWRADASHAGGSWSRPNAKNLNGKPRTRPDLNGATGPKVRWRLDLIGGAP